MNNSYKKYIKYKNKYIQLKGGGSVGVEELEEKKIYIKNLEEYISTLYESLDLNFNKDQIFKINIIAI